MCLLMTDQSITIEMKCRRCKVINKIIVPIITRDKLIDCHCEQCGKFVFLLDVSVIGDYLVKIL